MESTFSSSTQDVIRPAMRNQDSVRMDRDRFLAFSFCGADVLVELNEDRQITFSAGALITLAEQSSADVLGVELETLFVPGDRLLVTELLNRMQDSQAIEEALVTLQNDKRGPQSVILQGYFLNDLGKRFFVSLRRMGRLSVVVDGNEAKKDPESGLLVSESFIDLASARLEALNRDGDRYGLTTIELDGAAPLRSRLSGDGQSGLKAAIGACLRANSVGGNLAGDLGDDRYALVHDLDLNVGSLTGRLETVAKEADPSGIGVAVKAANVAANLSGMSDDDAARALIHAVKELEKVGTQDLKLSDLSQNLSNMVADTATKMTEVRSTITSGNFSVAFQPVVRLSDSRPHHYEALARFKPHDFESSPFEFIRLAEEVGMVVEFDLAMCRRVTDHIVGQDRTRADLPCAVNLSGRSLSSPQFLEDFHKLLGTFGEKTRSRLLIEITETVKPSNFEMARDFVARLRMAGHKVCLDDFGVGEMHIDYLRELNVDYVKIDGSYIKQARHDATNRALLKAITGLCRELKIATIAEMVEEENQLPFLKEVGVSLAQGYSHSTLSQ
ncbi:MAG: EAL domain-containing protein, partial [Pseudomonadota bacterium]